MPILVESRRKRPDTIKRLWPGTLIADVTSKGPEPWVRFSPFYPHGGIPIPNTPEQIAQSVEGLWQGLKVFEKEGIDPSKWSITTMRGIKRLIFPTKSGHEVNGGFGCTPVQTPPGTRTPATSATGRGCKTLRGTRRPRLWPGPSW